MGNKLPVTVARELRREQTEAERLLWFKLRDRHLDGIKFRRQHRIGSYVVDFICIEKRLIIEVDGGHHKKKTITENDEQRTQYFEAKGYRILRFWNSHVLHNTEEVLEKIERKLEHGCTLT
jgi:very-short-patch-repair endonuclease